MYSVSIALYLLWFCQVQSFLLENKDNFPLDFNCTIPKEKFANATAEFTICAINNSRPITLCEKCLSFFLTLEESYINMSKVMNNGTSCLDHLINFDRLRVVSILYENNVDLWTRAKCDECYEQANNNGNPKISNETKEFRKYYNNFIRCRNNKSIQDADLCSTCMNDYVKLDHYYKSISNINDKIGMCMDIVDLMNTTWTFWSVNCCKYRRHGEYIFIISTGTMLLLTIMFYLVVQGYKEENAPTIIQQSRFFESLSLFKD
uniref:Osteopetrosis-associated transmembrane protein 1 n=1 Tax=Diabrotica virgifera virgifera TaxID=50390 RepID=A0A6P7GW24_DIAVI